MEKYVDCIVRFGITCLVYLGLKYYFHYTLNVFEFYILYQLYTIRDNQ